MKIRLYILSLYNETTVFYCIDPDESVFNEIREMKLQCTEKYQTQAVHRSPPHLTLIPPFHYNETEETTVCALLAESSMHTAPFQIQLNGFSSFNNRVLYVQAIPNESLISLQQLVQNFGKASQMNAVAFHPHITIAFRDWEQVVFDRQQRRTKENNIVPYGMSGISHC